jgi:Kef-type K+ transport system membrane component KefB
MSDIMSIMTLSLLLVSTWGAGELVDSCFGWPALVGEICAGMLLGPKILDVVPYVRAVTTVGQMGLLLLVLEGGINIQLSTLKKIGWKAGAIALSGTALPVLLTWGLLPLLPGITSNEALLAGTALSR